MVNLYFMALEDNHEVLSTSHSSCDDYDDCKNSDTDDDKSSIVSKLVLKYKNLLSKKKLYKLELSKMSKE